MGGLEKAFDKSGDSLLGDLAQIIRRASSNDQYVGDVFKAQVTEVRPPVDTTPCSSAARGRARRWRRRWP